MFYRYCSYDHYDYSDVFVITRQVFGIHIYIDTYCFVCTSRYMCYMHAEYAVYVLKKCSNPLSLWCCAVCVAKNARGLWQVRAGPFGLVFGEKT